MKKHKIIYILITVVLTALCILGMAPKQKYEIDDMLGKEIENLDYIVQHTIKEKGIQITQDEKGMIVGIHILDPNYQLNGISIGDDIEKIKQIYPKEWIVKETHHVEVLLGNVNHFGIVTEHIIFILDKQGLIQEIRKEYTAPFMGYPLTKTNEEATRQLEGKWLSTHNRELSFSNGVLTDNLLDSIWEQQFYRVIKPNELFINRLKAGQSEKLKIRFWLSDNEMYLFLINEKGLPIQKSIETFIKQEY